MQSLVHPVHRRISRPPAVRFRQPADWQPAKRSEVDLDTPQETVRGGVALHYRQPGVKEALDVSSAGRGFLQMLLVFAYLFSHRRSVLLVDEPDAHLEILRQKQVYVLLRDIASENGCQVVIVTHSEVILDEALDKNLSLLLEGQADDLARKQEIHNCLRFFGAAHYVKARERRRKLSTLAEEFFRRLAGRRGGAMLLTKGELHRLGANVPVATIAPEVTRKLDLLCELFGAARNKEELSSPSEANALHGEESG